MDVFEFDLGLLVWTVITFGILIAVLARFAFKPVGRLLQQREDAIRDSLARAEETRRAAEKIAEENRAHLDEAREEARRVIQEGHRIVSDMRKEARDNARQEADEIVSQARAEIDHEVKRSLEDLKGTVAGLSVRISRQIIGGELDEQKHRQLADDFIERLKKTHARRKN